MGTKAKMTKVTNNKPTRKAPAGNARALKPSKAQGGDKYQPIRKDLMNQRRVLLGQVGVLPNSQEQNPLPDTTDQAQAEVDRNFILRLKEREQKLLKKIDLAIERIDNGTFGICRGCGNEIPLPRLKARPVTDLCIECKTRQEQNEMIRGKM
jgi:DnaK suppressor protein